MKETPKAAPGMRILRLHYKGAFTIFQSFPFEGNVENTAPFLCILSEAFLLTASIFAVNITLLGDTTKKAFVFSSTGVVFF